MRNYLSLSATNNAVQDCAARERPSGEAGLSDEQVYALADFCRHVTLAHLRDIAKEEKDAYLLREVFAKLRTVLEDAGVRPR